MNAVLQVGTQSITAQEIVPLLMRYQMMPKLLREIIVDQAIANIECTPEEKNQAFQQFVLQNGIQSEQALKAWLEQQGITIQQFEDLAIRELKLEKFKNATWEHSLESYFLQRKQSLDRVIYSLIRTPDAALAQELYFRIQEGEQTFAELAKEYSQGSEAQTDGLVGPIEISVPHPILTQLLLRSQPGQLSPPTKAGDWFVIVRLEKYLPAQLNDAMRQRLLQELLNNWLQEKIQQQMSNLNASSGGELSISSSTH